MQCPGLPEFEVY